jgi:hypothetical protein
MTAWVMGRPALCCVVSLLQCRQCSYLVCAACSSKQFPLLLSFSPLTSELHRVCDGCFNALTAFIDGSSRPPVAPTRSTSSARTGAATADSTTTGGALGRLTAATAGAGAGAGAGAHPDGRRASTAAGTAELHNTLNQTKAALGERGEKIRDIGMCALHLSRWRCAGCPWYTAQASPLPMFHECAALKSQELADSAGAFESMASKLAQRYK